ncbi:MAG: hypothetical protein NZ957_05760 [Thaumarchaeota archaeon]|nr:hypothetical protein [Candidatus Calditenuaceae archaeon]
MTQSPDSRIHEEFQLLQLIEIAAREIIENVKRIDMALKALYKNSELCERIGLDYYKMLYTAAGMIGSDAALLDRLRGELEALQARANLER